LPGWFSRHCVTAFCGLRPLVLQGEVSPCEPLWPAFQLYPHLPKPITHTRPRGIHASTRSFGVIQTMLLALPNVGLERMGRKNRSNLNVFSRPSAGYFLLFFVLRVVHKKPCRRSRCGFIRAYSTPK